MDGKFIRDHWRDMLDFTNFAQPFRFPNRIPQGEYWIDREYADDEVQFYILHMGIEYAHMRAGLSYADALTLADQAELAARKASAGDSYDPEFTIEQCLLSKLYETANGKKIYAGAGELIRRYFDVDWTEAGNWMADDFLPMHTVVLDDDSNPAEHKVFIAHECYEADIMEIEGLPYEQAHARANDLEWECRQDPNYAAQVFREVLGIKQ